MEEQERALSNSCSFAGIRPVMVDLPYPPIQVKERNRAYANLLSVDYCGAVSEMSAITQYINNENRLSCEKCPMAKTILGIAMAEMMHLTSVYLTTPENAGKMILADIDAEKGAISQYRMHMNMIKDSYINAILARIIKDEEYHIMFLQVLLREVQGNK